MSRRIPWVAAALLAWLLALPALATVDREVCSTAEAGATCSGAELKANINEELAELYKTSPVVLGSVAGTDTITASATPAITAYADGQVFQLKPANNNTGAVTLNINSVGAAALVDNTGTALSSGAISSTQIYLVRYYAASSHFRLLTLSGSVGSIQTFTASGTWTKPSGLKFAIVYSTGAGGGGGGADASSATSSYAAGGGGGAAGTCIEIFDASALATTETVTIGAAGTAGSATSGTTGGTGGNTTFGSLHTAAGGTGGTGANPGASTTTAGAGGAGGACTGGTTNLTGGDGSTGMAFSGPNTLTRVDGGRGGAGYFGGAKNGGSVTASGSAAGADGPVYGTGGSGASTHTTVTGAAGGAGAAGFVMVIEFRN